MPLPSKIQFCFRMMSLSEGRYSSDLSSSK
jgi:hypothetical protein